MLPQEVIDRVISQIKAAGQELIDKAEEIACKIDCTTRYSIHINDIGYRDRIPTITVETTFLSKKMLGIEEGGKG